MFYTILMHEYLSRRVVSVASSKAIYRTVKMARETSDIPTVSFNLNIGFKDKTENIAQNNMVYDSRPLYL